MPWHKVKDHKGCPTSKPWGVVQEGGKLKGCHASAKAANKQIAALNIHVEEKRMNQFQELWGKIKELFEPHLVEEPLERTLVQRQQDGRHRWFSISATATLNRVGEIDSRDLFDSFVAIANATGKYPQRDFMHLGQFGEDFVVGQTDFIARDGNCLITSGLYNDSELAQAEILARQAYPNKWGDSIRYALLDDPVFEEGPEGAVTPVLRLGHIKFVSTVPERWAASWFTTGTIQEERMALKDNELEAFVALFQDEEKAQDWLKRHVGDTESAIEDAGMMTRSVEPEAETEVKAKVEEKGDLLEVLEVDDELVAVLVERMGSSLSDRFAQIEDAIVAFQTDLKSLVSKSEVDRAEIDTRLVELEKDEQTREEEYHRDMPRSEAVGRLTYRPRTDQANLNTETNRPSFAGQADAVLDKLPKDDYATV